MSQLPIYFLILSAVYTFLIFFVYKRSGRFEFDQKIAMDLCFVLMVAGFIGGRLLHVFYESPQIYIQQPSLILKFWYGGFVFYGGFFSCLLAAYLFLKSKNESFYTWSNFMAPVFALGYSLGRWSCFFAGCCYGKFCEMPWAVKFAWDPDQVPRHPTQIYASLWEFIVFLILIYLEKRKFKDARESHSTFPLFGIWLVLHSIGRMVMEHFRDDFRGSFIAGMSISTWISVLTAMVGIIFIARKSQSRAS